ncbi:MAG: response regulator receiver protein [Parcubacteria group bacterium Athens0714_25]|nr:MAG: response regulator receiver protein [Parcubacteria group bacterium Athens0714_25]
MYAKAFIANGFEVIRCSDGKEVLKKIKENFDLIDLITLDIIMPKMDGFDLLEKIHSNAEYSKIPIIVLTNLDQNGDRDAALSLGAKKYLIKANTKPSQVVFAVKEQLGISSPQRKIV